MDIDNFSDRLAQLRLAKGVSARDMSLSLGQSENYINKIENRKAFPSMTLFFYTCEYFGISPQEFFDDGNANPERLTELLTDLKQLREPALSHIVGLVKELLK